VFRNKNFNLFACLICAKESCSRIENPTFHAGGYLFNGASSSLHTSIHYVMWYSHPPRLAKLNFDGSLTSFSAAGGLIL